MKTLAMAALVSGLTFAGIAHAQSPASEIRESTDPARVADVEQRAADVQARQQAARMNITSGDGSSSGSSGSGGDAGSRKGAKQHSNQQSGHRGGHGSGHGSSHGTNHGASGGQGGSPSK